MKYVLTKTILISILFSFSLLLNSQTNITGEVQGIWEKSNSPYLVNDDIYIPSGSKLTIEPGVKVQFTGHYKLNVNGTLLAMGTPDKMIHFTVADTTGWSNRNSDAGGWGGLLFDRTQSNDTSKIAFCKFEYGKARGNGWEEDNAGGAIFIESFSKIHIQNSVMANNWAKWYGGAIYCEDANPIFENLLIYGNEAVRNGGGICVESHSSARPEFINLTITDNVAEQGGGISCDWGCSPNIINTIIWNNSGEGGQVLLSEENADPNFINCIIEGGKLTFEGEGSYLNFNGKYINCIEVDPLFANPQSFNYQLGSNSHGINTGNLFYSNLVDLIDINGNNRVFGDSIDIGAYEYQKTPSNRIPVLADLPALQTKEDTPVEFEVSFFDPDLEDVHEVIVTSNVSDAEIVKMNDIVNPSKYKVIPPKGWQGTLYVTAKVVDEANGTSELNTRTFSIKVSNTIEAGGDIIKNTLWDADTIAVTSNIKIHDDVVLQITPGTVVEFQGDYRMDVVGTVSAIGGKNDSIMFCAKNAWTNWSGVKFINDWAGASGAMSNNDSTRFINCIFTGVRNYNEIGGAIYMRGYSKVLIKGCRISNNVSGYGAITCRFDANPRIEGNLIAYNQANQYGGGIWCDGSSPAIIGNTIIYNGHIDVPQLGGGIALDNSDAYIANNIIAYNHASSRGGGISCYYSSNPKIINNTICYNTAHIGKDSWMIGQGAGIACDGNSKPEIINTILWNNSNWDRNEQLALSSSNGFPLIKNCVIQGGLDSIQYISVEDLNGLKEVSSNILTQAPDFTNGQLLDFSLQSHSTCIDQGGSDTTGLSLPKLDYLHNPRIANESIDIGATEFQGQPGNKQPVLKRNGAVSGLKNAPIQMYVIFKDLNADDTHTVEVVSDNPDLQIISVNGDTTLSTYDIMPAKDWVGTGNVTVSVTDNSEENNDSDSYTYPLTIMETACGDIFGNTTWNEDTVKVTCDITVNENATLTISPGTVIEFQDYNRLNIYGRLLAKGELGDTIEFTVQDTTNYSYYHGHIGWNGVRFYNNIKDTSIVEYAKFEYGKAKNKEGSSGEDEHGGAIYASDYTSINISHCRFYRNYAAGAGSAIYASKSSPIISNCTFNENYARTSTIAASDNTQIIDNVVSYNESREGCAGISCSGSTLVSGNRIFNNKGGGMWCLGSPTILNTIICNNSGVGMSFNDCNTKKISNIIVYNNGTYGKSGLSMWTSYIDVHNSIINGYVDTGWGYPKFYNCILDVNGDVSKSFNDIDCIYAQPGFVAPSTDVGVAFDGAEADWSLLPTSYCINTGTEVDIPNFEKDISGNPRIIGDNIDIGAYEYQGEPQNRRPLIERIEDKKTVNFSEMELAVKYWDPDKNDQHTISVSADTPHVEIAELSGDTIGSTFKVVSVDKWEGTAQVIIQVDDHSGSDNSTALDTINITITDGVCGHISNNITWLGDTVKISCPVTIDDEVSLKIMPGTYIEFRKDAYLEVVGTLLAEGNKSDSIVFSAFDNETGWEGIRFKNGFYAYGHPSDIMDNNDSTKFTYCKFEYCNTRAVFIDNFHKLEISNSRFVNNQGQCIQTYEANPMIKNNIFEYNTCSNYESGTIWCERYSNPTIIGNIIRHNSGILGGGINCDYYSEPLIANNLIYNNNATSGGGIYCTQSSPKVINNTIVNNSATNGAGVYCRYSAPYLYNSIIWGNEASSDEYQVYNHRDAQNISNCMISENGISLENDNYETGFIIAGSPNFISESEHNYHLASNSVCINTGSNVYIEMVSDLLDVQGNIRINDSIVDMGAYEFQGQPDEMAPVKIDLSRNSVYENRPVRTFVGLLTTMDPNNKDIHNYSFEKGDGISDEGNSNFEIVGDTLFTFSEFDYETKDSYSILIASEDNTGRSITVSFIIKIWNSSEPPLLLNPIPDVNADVNEAFNFQIPENTFYKDEYSYYRYTANLIESNLLPPWLNFNQNSGSFTSPTPVVGTYHIEVKISDWYYVSKPDTFMITIADNDISIGKQTESIPINIYPNPSSNYFYVDHVPSDITKYRIIDVYGSVLFVQEVYGNNGEIKVDLSQYTDGIYLLQLVGNYSDKTYKLIKR